MKRALCALLFAAMVSFLALALSAAATIETEPMTINIQDENEDSSEDEENSSEDEEDSSEDEENSSEDEEGSSEDEENSSEDEEDSSEGEEGPPWWWDEEIDGVWYPGAENVPSGGEQAAIGSSVLRPVVIGDGTIEPNPALARVTLLLADDALAEELFPGKAPESVCFEAEILEGNYAGTTISAIRHLDEATAANVHATWAGDTVYLTLYRDESGTLRGEWSGFHRSPWLICCLTAIALLLLLCTRSWGGFKLLLVLAGAAACAFWAFPGLTGKGMDENGAAILCGLLLALLGGPVLYGVKYRTLAASLGAALSVGIVGLLFVLIGPALRLTGIASTDLLRASFREGIALHLFGGMALSAMLCAAGASVSSCMAAAAGAEPVGGEELTLRQAYLRGYRSGSSALAPLALAFCLFAFGPLVPYILPLVFAGYPIGRILSDEQVTAEIFRLIAGMLGLLASVPITSVLCALLIPLRRKPDGTLREFYLREAVCARLQKLFKRAAKGIDSATEALVQKTDQLDRLPEEESGEAAEAPEETPSEKEEDGKGEEAQD